MTDEEKKENGTEELSDLEIAELANKELRKRDAEISKLKKDLAQLKLLSTADTDEEVPDMSVEDARKVLFDSRSTNYDIMKAVSVIAENEVNEGRPNPLGKDGEEVKQFIDDCLEECGDDKSRFTQIYQAAIGNDPPEIAAAWKKRNKNN